MLLLGIAAFFLFFLYDVCELRPHQTWMSLLFPAGCLLLIAAIIGQFAPFSPHCRTLACVFFSVCWG